MKEKANSLLEEDTEEMKTWRGMGQDEMGRQKRSFQRQKRSVLEWRRVRRSKKKQNKKVERRLLGQNLHLVQRIQLAAAAEQAEESAKEEE